MKAYYVLGLLTTLLVAIVISVPNSVSALQQATATPKAPTPRLSPTVGSVATRTASPERAAPPRASSTPRPPARSQPTSRPKATNTPKPTKTANPTRTPSVTRTATRTVTPSPTPQICTTPLPVSKNAIVTETCMTSANRFSLVFSLAGYKPGEKLGAWLVDPNGLTISYRPDRQAPNRDCILTDTTITLSTLSSCGSFLVGPFGNASGSSLDASTLYPGVWSLVLQSKQRDVQSVIYFNVLERPVVANDPCLNLPASSNATVSPPCGQRGSIFKMVAQGFTPGEVVTTFVTAPDSIVQPLVDTYYLPKVADANGNATIVAFYPDNALRGNYFVTVVGETSAHQAVGAMRSR